jgi:hypothetical protein
MPKAASTGCEVSSRRFLLSEWKKVFFQTKFGKTIIFSFRKYIQMIKFRKKNYFWNFLENLSFWMTENFAFLQFFVTLLHTYEMLVLEYIKFEKLNGQTV